MALDQPLCSSRQRIRGAGGPASSHAAQSASSGGRRLLVHAAGVDGGRDVLPALRHRRRGAVFAHLPARPRPASFIAAMAWGSEASTRAAQVFPLLGPDYPLESAAAAVASALLTETFGFASGLVGYARRDLVDWAVAREILAIAVPGALVGAVCAPSLAGDAQLLRAIYALLMLSLATDLARRDRAAPPPGDKLADGAATAGGAFLTGLLGVGVGEVVLPQLSRDRPLPQAAGTSVAVVAGTNTSGGARRKFRPVGARPLHDPRGHPRRADRAAPRGPPRRPANRARGRRTLRGRRRRLRAQGRDGMTTK